MSKAWMPLYIGDYLGDTSHLNQGQHGAYLLLLMHYWQKGSLPKSKEQCYRIACAKHKQSMSNVDAVLTEFFPKGRNGRLELELEKASKAYEKRANAANKRWKYFNNEQISNGNGNSNAHALHEQRACDSDYESDFNSKSKPT